MICCTDTGYCMAQARRLQQWWEAWEGAMYAMASAAAVCGWQQALDDAWRQPVIPYAIGWRTRRSGRESHRWHSRPHDAHETSGRRNMSGRCAWLPRDAGSASGDACHARNTRTRTIPPGCLAGGVSADAAVPVRIGFPVHRCLYDVSLPAHGVGGGGLSQAQGASCTGTPHWRTALGVRP